MKSPRTEFRNASTSTGDGTADNRQLHQSTELHKSEGGKKGKRYSSHRRHQSDELNSILEISTEPPHFLSQTEIEEFVESPSVIDYQLSDPLPPTIPPLLPPRDRGGSGGAFNLSRNFGRPGWRRTHSSGTVNMSSKTGQLPVQPPHQDYHVPVDTLRGVHRTGVVHLNGAIGGPVPQPATHREQRSKDMHERILAHNDPSLNKRKSRSMDKLVDTSDYSIPFDVVPGGTPELQAKSRSPEGPSILHSGRHQPSSLSSSSINTHTTKDAPKKPPRTHNPPSFAPPPPPTNTDSPPPLPPSPTVVRRGDDYEEPWDSRRIHMPRHSSRRQRSETDTKQLPNPARSPRSHRAHTVNHETPSEPEGMGPIPLRTSPRPHTDFSQSDPAISPCGQPEFPHPRTNTGELSDPFSVHGAMYYQGSNGVVNSNGGSWIEGPGGSGCGSGGGGLVTHVYVNQPPMPARNHVSANTTTNEMSKKKHKYPPLVPSDHYISDIQNLPPPLYPIDTSVHLEEQP